MKIVPMLLVKKNYVCFVCFIDFYLFAKKTNRPNIRKKRYNGKTRKGNEEERENLKSPRRRGKMSSHLLIKPILLNPNFGRVFLWNLGGLGFKGDLEPT